jgi:hypothetical protein
LGGFLRNPPLLSHTGTGQFTITNYNAGKEYAVFTADGTPQAGTTVSNGVVNMGGVFGEYFVSYASDTKLSRAVKFQRARITYRTETTTSCSDNCGVAYDCAGSPVPNCRPCWGSGADGNYCCGGICCGGSRGQTCTTTSRQVKNPVPAGYTEQYGEWVRIENPVSTREVVEEKDTGVFTLPQVEWEEDYYTAVQMPVPNQAQVINEDTGEPTGEYLENVPAWEYDAVYFIHYNLDGDVVWMKDYINDPECFTVVQKELMTDYEMWVSNLPAAYEGTYEFVIANEEQEFVREEGSV